MRGVRDEAMLLVYIEVVLWRALVAQYRLARPYAQPWQLGPGGQELVDKVANPALQAVFAGKTTPKDALAEIENKGNAVLAQH